MNSCLILCQVLGDEGTREEFSDFEQVCARRFASGYVIDRAVTREEQAQTASQSMIVCTREEWVRHRSN